MGDTEIKYTITLNKKCYQCGDRLEFGKHYFDELGAYHVSEFYCPNCKIDIYYFADILSEPLVDNTVILPDTITETKEGKWGRAYTA